MDAAELFETYDEAGRPLGQRPRGHVHASGLWHRSVGVFLFDTAGRLLLQRRATGKDVGAGLWDYTVGEHLRPGESYLAAARRGLAEELALEDVTLCRLGPVRRYRLDLPELKIHDYEFQQTFRGGFTGSPVPAADEVAAVRAVDRIALAHWMRRRPEAFTPWLRAAMTLLD